MDTVIVNDGLIDDEPFNNVFPRQGQSHIIRAQYNFDPYLTEIKQPITGIRSFLGRTINFTTGLINDGLIDISVTSEIQLKTTVFRYTNNLLGAAV